MSIPPILYTTDNVRVKNNAYFHEKDNMWNSPVHSCDKIFEFYLKSANKRLYKDQGAHRSLKYLSKRDTKSTTQLKDSKAESSSSRVNLRLHKKAMEREKEHLKYMQRRMQEEEHEQIARQLHFQEKRSQRLNFLKLRHSSISDLEQQVGIYKIKEVVESSRKHGSSRRLKELSKPKSHGKNHQIASSLKKNQTKSKTSKRLSPLKQSLDREVREHKSQLHEFDRRFGNFKTTGFPKIHLESVQPNSIRFFPV